MAKPTLTPVGEEVADELEAWLAEGGDEKTRFCMAVWQEDIPEERDEEYEEKSFPEELRGWCGSVACMGGFLESRLRERGLLGRHYVPAGIIGVVMGVEDYDALLELFYVESAPDRYLSVIDSKWALAVWKNFRETGEVLWEKLRP